jgi:hypothetical protein
MIKTSLEYSKLVIREANVFFRIKEDKPYILYYYLIELNIEAKV